MTDAPRFLREHDAEQTPTGKPSPWPGTCGYCGFKTDAVACPKCGLWGGVSYRKVPMTTQQPGDVVERVAVAIERTMFAPHEFPLDAELHAKYLHTAHAAISAMDRLRAQPDAAAMREAEWHDIREAQANGHGFACIVQYENGHVTAAEYCEQVDGGPDDIVEWVPWHSPQVDGEYKFDWWPVAWQPFPDPSAIRALPLPPAAENDGG